MKKQKLHPDVIEKAYKGFVLRFRVVDEDCVYIPVADIRGFLQCRFTTQPIFAICASATKIEFYSTGRKSLISIRPYDIKNLYFGGRRKKDLDAKTAEKIDWLETAAAEAYMESMEQPTSAVVEKPVSSLSTGDIDGYVDKEGTVWLDAESIAVGFGFCQEKNNAPYVRWERVNAYLESFGFSPQVGKGDYIPENMVYRLGFKANNDVAERFQSKLADEIIPSIRKTGAYIQAKEDDTPEIIMARGILAAQETIARMQNQLKEREARILNDSPKVKYYDTVVTERELFGLYQLAAELGTSYHTLRQKLYEHGVLKTPTGKLEISEEFADWGRNDAPIKRYRGFAKGLRFNLKGRESIFDIINPQMPK